MLSCWGIVLCFVVVCFEDVAGAAKRLVLENDVEGVDDAGNVWDGGLVGGSRMREGRSSGVETYNQGWSGGC